MFIPKLPVEEVTILSKGTDKEQVVPSFWCPAWQRTGVEPQEAHRRLSQLGVELGGRAVGGGMSASPHFSPPALLFCLLVPMRWVTSQLGHSLAFAFQEKEEDCGVGVVESVSLGSKWVGECVRERKGLEGGGRQVKWMGTGR